MSIVAYLFASYLLLVKVYGAANSAICNDVQWGSFVSGEPFAQDGMQKTIQFDNMVGRSSSIVHWYANWGDGSGDFVNSWNAPKFAKIITNFTSLGNSAHTPMLTWQPWGPTFDKNVPTFKLTDIAAGLYDSYIDSVARGIKNLGYLFYLRPMHEMDGDWYPWGTLNGNTPSQFVGAWKRIVDRFRLVNVPNVRFVWCPNNSNNNGIDQTVFFPGDDYVDWICLDAYAETPASSFASTITNYCNPANPYQRLTAVSTKPMMIAEWGVKELTSSGPTKAQWYIDAANAIPTQFPRVKALVYFHEYGYKVDTSSSSISGVRSAFGDCAGGVTPTSAPTSAPVSSRSSSTPATSRSSSTSTSRASSSTSRATSTPATSRSSSTSRPTSTPATSRSSSTRTSAVTSQRTTTPISTPISTSTPTSTCGCGTLNCCASACYNPTQHVCVLNQKTLNLFLCPLNSLSCGAACYSPSQYTCDSSYNLQPVRKRIKLL